MTQKDSLRVLHITDLHLHADTDSELYGVNTDNSFRAALDAGIGSGGGPPDVILVTGDIAEDCSREAYERFHSVMQGVGVPILCLPGNHDDPVLAAQILNDGHVSFCRAVDIGDWRFVLLNSHVAGDDGGALSDGELQRLDAELRATGDRHVLVAVHHQPLEMGSAWLDGYGLRNAAEFLPRLLPDRNVRAVVWGHVHQASERQIDGIRMLSTPSTCAQFTPGTTTCIMDTRPPGFRTLILGSDGSIQTEVAWLEDWRVNGRPPDSRQQSQEDGR